MIIEFTVANYLSFKEPQTLSMVAAKIKSKNKLLDEENTFEAKHTQLLKSKAIYGANGSGKSNLIKAFKDFSRILQFSLKDERQLDIDRAFHLNDATVNEPTLFQLV